MLHFIIWGTRMHKHIETKFYSRVSRPSLSQSFQLHNSPVTQLKLPKPFYLLKAAFLPVLPDHSPFFSHKAIAASCLQATSCSSPNHSKPCSLIAQEPQILLCSTPDLYDSTFTSDFSSIQYFQSSHFSLSLNIFSLAAGTFCSPPMPAASFILWLSPQRKADFAPHAPGRAFKKPNTCCIYEKSVLASREEVPI